MARFYIVTKENGKAEEIYKKAISMSPNSSLAHSEYGKFLAQQNRAQEAEAELLKSVEVGPNDRNARFVLASFYLVNRQLDKAENEFKALAALDQDKPQSQMVLADFIRRSIASTTQSGSIRTYFRSRLTFCKAVIVWLKFF